MVDKLEAEQHHVTYERKWKTLAEVEETDRNSFVHAQRAPSTMAPELYGWFGGGSGEGHEEGDSQIGIGLEESQIQQA